MYRFAEPAEVTAEAEEPADGSSTAPSATLLFSGPMWQAAMEARAMLAADWGVSADAWSVTSYTELREDALSVERGQPPAPARRARRPLRHRRPRRRRRARWWP